MEIKMVDVESSNIARIGWAKDFLIMDDSQPLDVLRIEFSHGKSYDYMRVPEEVYKEMLSVESKGSFFFRKIKNSYAAVPVN